MKNTTKGIAPIAKYLEELHSAQHKFSRVPGASTALEFEEIRKYLIAYSDGFEPFNSFVDSNGSVFDCIPIEQQRALRNASIIKPPSHEFTQAGRKMKGRIVEQLSPYAFDRFGNRVYAEEGTIPVRRVQLWTVLSFGSLKKYESKSPYGEIVPTDSLDIKTDSVITDTHRWAYAYQNINCIGLRSEMTVWKPVVSPPSIFSLSQVWLLGSGTRGIQTAEAGWQVYPQLYGGSNPVFFIYWTADNYQTTGGYNLGGPFVQTNHAVAIGGAINDVSVPGGQNYAIEAGYWLDIARGAMWLLSAGTVIGYYPLSIYGPGGLSAQATMIEFGGEVVSNGQAWPQMGSGSPASGAWNYTAQQFLVEYFIPHPGTGGYDIKDATGLTATSTSSCYTAAVQPFDPQSEHAYFRFGGQGGGGC